MSPTAKPITLKKNSTPRPSTPVKTFLAKDPGVLPPSPSPKKTPAATAAAATAVSPVKTKVPSGGSPLKKHATMGDVMRPTSPVRPASPLRQSITQVREFKFATETRSRRSSPEKMKANMFEKEGSQSRISQATSPRKSTARKQMEKNIERQGGEQMAVDEGVMQEEEVDEGLAVRMKAHEI